MGFWQQLTGQEGGSLIPGVDNPFHNSQTTWLPGLGAANPLNSDSAVGKAVKDLGALNVANPNSVAGRVVSNVVTDIGKDPLKWAAVAVAIAAGQPQLIPSIMSVAKLTSKPSSPEEWITEGIKAAAIKYGGDWVAANVAGASGYVGSTADGQDWIAGTGVAGATGSATAAKVAANAARGMFATAAQNGTTDINGAKIITSAITGEGLNQAMAEIPGWDTLSKGEQSTAVNAFKVAFNKDESAAYNLFNQGFDKVVKEADREAAELGYNSLENRVKINDLAYSRGTAEDRTLLNKLETDYKTARTRREELSDAWHNTMGDPVAQGEIDNELSKMADLQNRTVRNFGEFSADLSSRPAGLHDDFDTITGTTGTDTIAGGTQDVAERAKVFGVGDVFGTGEQITLYADGRVKDSDDAAPRALTAEEAASINPTFPGAVAAKETSVVDDLTNAGLHDDLDDTDLTKVVGGTDTTTTKPAEDDRLSQAIEKGKAGDFLGQINLQREIVGLPKYNSIEEYEAYEEAEQAKRVAEFGKDLTGGGNQDLGKVDTKTNSYDENSTGMGAYKYDPTSGTYTYTSDDGSTLTLDGNGDIVGFTEKTDTSWNGLTDTATGNLKLPGLPGGKKPTVKPPAKKTTTTTTTTKPAVDTTKPAVDTTKPVVTTDKPVVDKPADPSEPVKQSGDMGALLSILGALGGGSSSAPTPAPTVDIGAGADFDPFGELMTNPFAKQQARSKMAQAAEGGSVDDLLALLDWKG